MSFFALVDPALAALGIAPEELQIAGAAAVAARYYPNLSTDRPALIGVLQHAETCQELGRLLQKAYPANHSVTLVGGLGSDSPRLQPLSLGQLGQAELGDGMWLLYVPPLPCPGAVETFQATVAHLRAPDGCPWDRQQTHRSLRQGFQEEAYEVLDALDRGDVELLKEELGDMLLHILLQVQIATEQGEFRMSDVVCRVNTKIVHRHPHVFGDLAVQGVEEVLVNWEELKQQEKQGRAEAPSSLDGISPAMPALARAQSIQRHVDRLGVVSEGTEELVDRISAALAHLLAGGGARGVALGDLLFDLTNLARKLGIDAESALREANTRFEEQHREFEAASRDD
jgi:tetrapyrrole methylase family protein/MazG family protein